MKMIQTIWESLKTNWASIIATLAFLISFATLYYTYWQPFKPQIYSSGRYEILRSDANIKHYAVSLALNFSNLGAKTGVIEGLYLEFHISNNRRVLLIPRYQIEEKLLNIARQLKPMEAREFLAFSLNPKETTSKKIMFAPHSPSDEFDLGAGKYEIDIYAKTSKNNEWEKYNTVEINLTEEDIKIMNNFKVANEGELTLVPSQNKFTAEIEKEFDVIHKSFSSN